MYFMLHTQKGTREIRDFYLISSVYKNEGPTQTRRPSITNQLKSLKSLISSK